MISFQELRQMMIEYNYAIWGSWIKFLAEMWSWDPSKYMKEE